MMLMDGPFHRAMLETLDRCRKKELYEDFQHGHMLGTAFHPDIRLRSKYTATLDVEVCNGLW